MSCPHINAFFSCSFRPDDHEINEYFKSVCEGLNITSKNVSDGYTSTPPEVARRMIEDCKIVIAIIPKREQTNSGLWTMPSAVHEEMAMAFALKKPTLLVIEDEVNTDGFMSNFGTFLKFKRAELYAPPFIKKIVSSVHELRLQAVEQNKLLPDQDAAGFFAEKVSFLVEVYKEGDKVKWKYNSSRKLVFTRPFDGQIKNSAWADYLPPEAIEKIEHTVSLNSNRELLPQTQTIKDTPQQIEIGIGFEKAPQKDDWIEIDFEYSSPHLNATKKSQIIDEKRSYINGKTYDCLDGLIPIQASREMHLQFRFPAWYPIDVASILPIVGSYSAGIDYVVESEIKRCQINTTKFGGNLQIDIKIESPLLRHVYGIAWNLKQT